MKDTASYMRAIKQVSPFDNQNITEENVDGDWG